MNPILDLLAAEPGSIVYHLLILFALQMIASVALVEWRHTRSAEHRRTAWTCVGLVALRLVQLVAQPLIQSRPDRAALLPLVDALDVLSVGLLVWAVTPPIQSRVYRYLWAVHLAAVGLAALVSVPAWPAPVAAASTARYAASWQQFVWHGWAALLLALAAGALILRRRWSTQSLQIAGLSLMAFGFGCTAFDVLGLGRFIVLVSYSLVTAAVYRTALQELWTDRTELQVVSSASLRLTQEQLFLLEASRALGASLDLNTTLQKVVESVAMALNADRCAIFLCHPEDTRRVALAAHYTVLQRHEIPENLQYFDVEEQPILAHALQRQRQLTLSTDLDNPRLQSLYTLLKSPVCGPTLIQPLARQQDVLGLVVVGNAPQRPFKDSDTRLCQSIAMQVAVAVENAQLYTRLEAQTRELAALLRMREEEAGRREAILESVGEGVIVTDVFERVVLANAATEKIMGAPRERLLGRSFVQLLGRVSTGPEMDLPALAHSGATLTAVFELERKFVRVSAATVRNTHGEHLGFVAILRDVTRETLAEQAKVEFISTISHELRTPLTAIKGYAEVLNSGMVGPLSDSQSHFLDIIHDNAVRMVGLTDNLIAVSQIEKGYLRLDYQETDLELIVNQAVHGFEAQRLARQMDVRLELAPDLPVLQADAARVSQVIANLVSNALKYTYPGGQVTVGARLLPAERSDELTYCAIWVADTGIGIPPDEQARIWERFYRAENPLKIEAGGVGVGLSIVKSLVEAHGGRVWVDSVPGKGSTFTVLLPTAPPQHLVASAAALSGVNPPAH